MKTPFVPQLGDVDCGPACLASILAAHGRHVRVSDVARACETGRDGTSAASLVRGARELGLSARAVRLVTSTHDGRAPDVAAALTSAGLPAVVLMRGHHFVVVESVDRGRRWWGARIDRASVAGRVTVRVNDPGQGHQTMSLSDFAEGWMGLAIVVGRGPQFTTGGSRPPGAVRQWWGGEDTRSRLLTVSGILFAVLTSAAALLAVLLVRGIGVEQVSGLGVVGDVPRALALLAVIAWLAGLAGARLRSRLLHRTVTRRSSELVHHLLRVSPAYLQHRFSGEVAMRPQRIDGAAMQIVALFVDGVVGLLTVGAGLAAIAHGSWSAFAMVLAGLGADAWAIGHGLEGYREAHRRAVAEQQRRDGEIISTLTAIETLRSEASPEYLVERWTAAQQRVSALEHRANLIMLRRTRLTMLVDGTTTALVLWICHLDAAGPATALVLALMTGLVLGAGRRVVSLGAFDLTQVQTALRLVEDVLVEPAQDGLSGPDRVTDGVVLTGLSFRRPGVTRPLFAGVDLDIAPGETCFIVGQSGVGKSTLARVIVGAVGADAGSVARPAHVAYVPQRALFLEGTVAQNLTLGHDTSLAALDAVLDAVSMRDVVDARGGVLRATVTQGGRNFSGGERQRLALARALLRSPDLLVLDEAFSAMDDRLTDELHERLRRLGIPVVSVAHHLPRLGHRDLVVRLTPNGLLTEVANRPDRELVPLEGEAS